jgi:hypothetical protein
MKINVEITKENLEKPIIPVGETYEDTRRLENLKERIDLIEYLLLDVRKTAEDKNRIEYSMREAGKLADDFLNSLTVYPTSL